MCIRDRLETVRLRQAADEARQIAEAARQNYLRVKNGPRAEEIAQARANVQDVYKRQE